MRPSGGGDGRARWIAYHVAPVEVRNSIACHGLDWRRLGVGGAYRPPGNYLWNSFEFALWYAQAAYNDYDIWAVNVEGLQLLADPGFGEFADGVEHACFSRQPIAAERLRGIAASRWWRDARAADAGSRGLSLGRRGGATLPCRASGSS